MTSVETLGGTVDLPNSRDRITRSVEAGVVRAGPTWGMLLFRPAMALVLQATFALGFATSGSDNPWRQAADWWLVSLALGEFLNLGLLGWRVRREGLRLRDLFNPGGRRTLRGDLRWLLLALIVAGPVGFLPNLLIGGWLWGDAQVGSDLSFRAIPIEAAWATLMVFPIIHALTELPTYFGYVMPRLQVLRGSRWAGLAVCASVLAAQHMFLPLLFDWRFVVWRLFMFLPFAFWIGWVIDRRPTTLPYLAAAHGLLDLSLPLFVLFASMP
jgi:hypothetical protein